MSGELDTLRDGLCIETDPRTEISSSEASWDVPGELGRETGRSKTASSSELLPWPFPESERDAESSPVSNDGWCLETRGDEWRASSVRTVGNCLVEDVKSSTEKDRRSVVALKSNIGISISSENKQKCSCRLEWTLWFWKEMLDSRLVLLLTERLLSWQQHARLFSG